MHPASNYVSYMHTLHIVHTPVPEYFSNQWDIVFRNSNHVHIHAEKFLEQRDTLLRIVYPPHIHRCIIHTLDADTWLRSISQNRNTSFFESCTRGKLLHRYLVHLTTKQGDVLSSNLCLHTSYTSMQHAGAQAESSWAMDAFDLVFAVEVGNQFISEKNNQNMQEKRSLALDRHVSGGDRNTTTTNNNNDSKPLP